jgi:hypothetical protein
MTVNPRALAVIRQERADALRRKALAAAANRLEASAGRENPSTRLRTGKRTAEAIAALQSLRRDISIGLPAEALIDRIDDVLFRLKR